MLLINAVMMIMFVWVARMIGAVFAAMTANVITLSGVLWGWVIFAEVPSPWIWAAMAAMALGVALVTLRHASPLAAR
jgi:drug/metabolite transporter (DMT)-like permease